MLNDQWYTIFTTSRLVFFMVGLAIGAGWRWWRCRKEHQHVDLNSIGIIAGVAIIVFVAIQQVGLAAEVKECQAEFNTVLQERANLTDQSDTFAGNEIEANSQFFALIANPPPEIAKFHTTDPEYRSWVHDQIVIYSSTINKIRDQRQQALDARKQQQYPAPSCGR